MTLPDPSAINIDRAYVVEGAHYKALIQSAAAVQNMTGLQGIEVKVSDARITVGIGGLSDPNAINGAALTWSVTALNVCNGNAVNTIYVLAGVTI